MRQPVTFYPEWLVISTYPSGFHKNWTQRTYSKKRGVRIEFREPDGKVSCRSRPRCRLVISGSGMAKERGRHSRQQNCFLEGFGIHTRGVSTHLLSPFPQW